jgi:CheY-like chemotaxis protein
MKTLVVDDNAADRKILRYVLKGGGVNLRGGR